MPSVQTLIFSAGLAQEKEDAANKGGMKDVYRITKKLSGKRNISHHQAHSKDGKLLTSESEQLNRGREHFEERLNGPSPTTTLTIPAAPSAIRNQESNPKYEEL